MTAAEITLMVQGYNQRYAPEEGAFGEEAEDDRPAADPAEVVAAMIERAKRV